MNHKLLFLVVGVLLGAALLYALVTRPSVVGDRQTPSASSTVQTQTSLSITTSIYPLYFFTKAIVGDLAEVQVMVPAGAEPHDYEPTPQDVARLQASRLVIVNGGVEPWIDDLAQDLERKQILVLKTGEGLLSRDVVDEDNETVKDPHIWLSPRLSQRIVDRIVEALVSVDPAHAESYRARGAELKRKLVMLDQQFTQGLQGCTQSRFITSHLAFGYLAADYGLIQIGIAGLSPEAEPSPRELGEIVTFAKANQITYIFFETLVNPKLANTLAQEVGAQTLVLNPLEGLTAEEMSQGKDYFTEMQQNLANLRLALACPPANPKK